MDSQFFSGYPHGFGISWLILDGQIRFNPLICLYRKLTQAANANASAVLNVVAEVDMGCVGSWLGDEFFRACTME